MLTCPRCGMETNVPGDTPFVCEQCGGMVKRMPNGKAWILVPAKQPAPREEEIQPLLSKAATTEDPVKKHALLAEAESICPDSLDVQTELLHLGRLYQRDMRKPDLHNIKCYLLHAFECPEEEAPDVCESMLCELTHDARLETCLSLCTDKEAYLTQYLTRLSREYINLFLKGSNVHMQRFLGFQLRDPAKVLAFPAAMMLKNMEETPLPRPFDRLLPSCFLQAFEAEVGSTAFVMKEWKELKA